MQAGELVCKMGGKLSNRLHWEAGDQRLLLRLPAYHRWGPPGIGTHAVHHLHKWPVEQSAFSSHLLIPNWVVRQTCQMGDSSYRKTKPGWKRGLERTVQNSTKTSARFHTWNNTAKELLGSSPRIGAVLLVGSLAEKDLGPSGHMLNMNCAAAAMKTRPH